MDKTEEITKNTSPETTKENTFRTDDVNLAAFMKAKGGKLLNIGLTTETFRSRYYFEFEDAQKCNTMKFDYINGAQVSAKDFVEAKDMFVKEIKSLTKGFQ